MPNKREKLALSVCNATQKTNYKCDFNCEKKGKCAYCLVMAEQMIAYGVTVQEWVPVKERLPQEDLPVGALCEVVQVLLNDGSVTIGWCNRGLQCWFHMPIRGTKMVGHEYEKTPVIAWQPLARTPKKGMV